MTNSTKKMPQRSVILPKYLDQLMVKYAAETGQSLSGAIAQCAEIGLFSKIHDINAGAVFLKMEATRQNQRVSIEQELESDSD